MLIDQLAAEEFLLNEAWKNINKFNPESFGYSGETIEIFKKNLDTQIPALSKKLKYGYNFSPTRASVIPKKNGKYRPLQIPEVKDRVVLKGIAILLEMKLQSDLEISEGVSFAYQKGLGVQHAIMKMQEYYNQGYHTILEADIENFFPTVNRTKLLDELCSKLPDGSLNNLIV